MTTKFKGSIDDLKARLEAASISGKWSGEGQSKPSFRSDDGGILNWWPNTGTVQLQGKEEAKATIEAAISGVNPYTPYRPWRFPCAMRDRFLLCTGMTPTPAINWNSLSTALDWSPLF